MIRLFVAFAVLLSALHFCAPAVADAGIADGAGARTLVTAPTSCTSPRTCLRRRRW